MGIYVAEKGSSELENLFMNLKESGKKRVEFRIRDYKLSEPVVLRTGVRLVPIGKNREGPDLVEGYVSIRSCKKDEVINALGQIERTISILSLWEGELDWWLAIPHIYVKDIAERTPKHFEEVNKIIASISSRFGIQESVLYYRALHMYRHACEARNPFDLFLFSWNCIEIVSEILYRENKKEFRRSKSQKEKCVKAFMKGRDLTPNTIHRCHEYCLQQSIRRKVEFTFETLLPRYSTSLIKIFFHLDNEPSLYDIRNDIVHGRLSMYNVKDIMLIEERDLDIRFFAEELLHRAIGLSVCGESIRNFLLYYKRFF
jgi:hypothetical protein